jgi:hypothetical protein
MEHPGGKKEAHAKAEWKRTLRKMRRWSISEAVRTGMALYCGGDTIRWEAVENEAYIVGKDTLSGRERRERWVGQRQKTFIHSAD